MCKHDGSRGHGDTWERHTRLGGSTFRFDPRPPRTSPYCNLSVCLRTSTPVQSLLERKKGQEICCNTFSSGEDDSTRPYVPRVITDLETPLTPPFFLISCLFLHRWPVKQTFLGSRTLGRSPRQVLRPLAPFIAASTITFYLVNQMQDLGVRCTYH